MFAIGALAATAACSSSLDRATAAAGRAQALFAAGRYSEAVAEAQQAVKLRDDVPDLWLLIARGQMAQRNFGGAFYAYNRVNELDQSNVEALRALAELMVLSSNYNGADKYTDQMLTLNPRDVNALLLHGFALLGRDRTDAAAEIATKVEAIDSGNVGGKVLRARILLRQGDTAKSLALLEPLAQAPDASWDVLGSLQMAYRATGNGDGLEMIARRLVKANPKNSKLQVDLARELYLNGKPDAAAQALIAADKNIPLSAEFQDQLSDLWVETDTPTPVAQALTAADPTASPNVAAAAAQLALLRGDPQRALAMISPLVKAAGDLTRDNADVWALNAVALHGAGRGVEAAAAVDKILAIDPSNANALLTRAQMEQDSGNTDAATADVMVLIRDNPKLPQARLLLASIYMKRKETLLARDALAAAVLDLPDNAMIMLARSRFLLATGQKAEAIESAAAFTRKNPDSITGWQARGELCIEARNECIIDSVQTLLKIRMGERAARTLVALATRAGLGISAKRA